MNTFSLLRSLALSLLLVLMGVITPLSGFAQDGSSGSLVVSPLLVEMDVEAAKSYPRSLSLKNEFPEALEIEIVAVDVEVESGSRNVQFLAEESKQNALRSLASWMQFSEEDASFLLESGESRELSFQVQVPEDVSAGDYFASVQVYFRRPGEEEGLNTVNVKQSIGSLFLVKVQGASAGAASAEYSFSELSLKANGEKMFVSLNASNDTLRYLHLKPQISIVNDAQEVQFQSVGPSVRVFPGETVPVKHSFPKDYLSSIEPLTLTYSLWDREQQMVHHEASLELETAYAGYLSYQDFWIQYGKKLLAGAIVVVLTVLVWCWWRGKCFRRRRK